MHERGLQLERGERMTAPVLLTPFEHGMLLITAVGASILAACLLLQVVCELARFLVALTRHVVKAARR